MGGLKDLRLFSNGFITPQSTKEKNLKGISFLSIFNFFKFIFRHRVREGEREGEKHQCVVASGVSPTGDLAHYPGMCSDWESKQ